jgi:hypothetical protein
LSAEAGVRVKYTMPDLEWAALERIRPSASRELVRQAVEAHQDAGSPALRDWPLPPAPLDPTSLVLWRVCRWWLRQPAARTVLTPERLVKEAAAASAAGDRAVARTAIAQLCRIHGDPEHPDRAAALEALRGMIPEGTPERERFERDAAAVTAIVAALVDLTTKARA